MNKGKHLIIDCKNVAKDICLDDRNMMNVICTAIEKAGANILSTSRYRLGHNSPPGFACVIMLDESHCSAHSYANDGLLAIDLFTCGKTDPMIVFEYIRDQINLGDFEFKLLNRFQ